jgi:hypothetical protein
MHSEIMQRETTYYGESSCSATLKSGKPCSNRAYYSTDAGELVCGVHRKGRATVELRKRPEAELTAIRADKKQAGDDAIETCRLANVAAGRRGSVALYRMRMMRAVPDLPGYRRVYPNYKHQDRRDGLGCARLSPMSLGPVRHGQPGLPDALNVENFHQGSKLFREEVSENGNPLPRYYNNRRDFYLDPVPHRHKYKGTGSNKNVPLCFIWVAKDGEEHRLSYVESRQFYCNFYERLARQEPDYTRLEQLLARGVNLQLCGYDAHPPGENQSVEEMYLDATKPFGHERVLYAMLTCARGDEESLPWRKHKTFDF